MKQSVCYDNFKSTFFKILIQLHYQHVVYLKYRILHFLYQKKRYFFVGQNYLRLSIKPLLLQQQQYCISITH